MSLNQSLISDLQDESCKNKNILFYQTFLTCTANKDTGIKNEDFLM